MIKKSNIILKVVLKLFIKSNIAGVSKFNYVFGKPLRKRGKLIGKYSVRNKPSVKEFAD